ncbi:3-phosphoserine/phosphohydroxythreonine transaminase [Denitromonas halophila]|uniref:Phosphoserine aminotransferase n=1 Tax=Denitromonas halophila TaxID=1629404 RepID=A0A557QJF8_9RHOO|nr:3-phosphoserine/phosphohydroxythreonine transaminase [Denitromonas halophila]TVO53040.1 3-phosphoserine/phosphohydroxythreonine transaminase [Denitromonas halophila]
MSRVFNFSAGPAALPESVLRRAAEEMLDWHGTGVSVMEMSHRSPAFQSIYDQAEADLRELLAVPSNYRILFMQGGAIAENALVPMNLLGDKAGADYVVTGSWSAKSQKEARRYCDVNIAAATEAGAYNTVPALSDWRLSDDPAYLFVCTNETIDGVEFGFDPDLRTIGRGEVPVVADVSSHILSRTVDVSRYGVLFGGAQKNIGPAGLTIVIVREDLLGRAHKDCPSAFDYKLVADNNSMYNTPPTYAIYIAGLVFQWLRAQGGVEAIEAINIKKADRLYGFIDQSNFYQNRIDPRYRSRMNVPFFLADESRNAAFLEQSSAAGLVQLKGHKSVGGMRASIYNAMPMAGVEALVEFMRDFERRNG